MGQSRLDLDRPAGKFSYNPTRVKGTACLFDLSKPHKVSSAVARGESMHSPSDYDSFDSYRYQSAEEIEYLPPRPSPLRRLWRFIRGFLEISVQTALLTFLMIYFVAQATVVHGQSMEPNLHTDQRIIIEKLSYRFDMPDRGDVVVIDIEDFDLPLIKRVVGLPGETIEIKDNHVFINGKLLQEEYLPIMRQQNYGPFLIPEDHIFVMGDNRNVSNDSRFFGPIHEDQILGRAWVSYWPPEDFGLVK
jgi:signal peptidase I